MPSVSWDTMVLFGGGVVSPAAPVQLETRVYPDTGIQGDLGLSGYWYSPYSGIPGRLLGGVQ